MSSEKLNDLRLYNHSIFASRKTPRREKILMAIIDERLTLAPDDHRYKNVLVQAFAIMSEYPAIKKQLRLIQELDGGIGLTTAYRVINDAQYVFGNIQESNRVYLKNAQRERLYRYIKKLEEQPKVDYKTILYVEDLLMKLDDLPKALPGADKEEQQDYTIPMVEFTSDPQALIEEAKIVGDEEE